MINSPDIYRRSGFQAGKARRNRDESSAKFESDWYRRAMALETPEDKLKAKEAWEAEYREGNPPQVPVYFR